MGLVGFLSASEGHKKHDGGSLLHPLSVFFLGSALVVVVCGLGHEFLVSDSNDALTLLKDNVGVFLITYLAALLMLRVPSYGMARMCYEVLWCCNMALLLAGNLI